MATAEEWLEGVRPGLGKFAPALAGWGIDFADDLKLLTHADQCSTFPGIGLRAQSSCQPPAIKSGIDTRKSGITTLQQLHSSDMIATTLHILV